jgi:glycosyltransferase involved in cell wall biosynthesis
MDQHEPTPLVSVCMPVSRSTAEIARSLAGVTSQTLRDLEIVVSDDSGNGRAAVEQIGDPRARYWHNQEPLGFVGNHEAALNRARGSLLAFLHDDDAWEPTYLARAVQALESSPEAGFVLTAHRELPGKTVSPHPPAGFHAAALPILLGDRFRLLPSATVIRRPVLAKTRRPWPDLSCGDMVLYLDAAMAGWGVTIVDDPLVAYSRHPGQLSAEDIRFREDLASLFELYRFEDPAVERLRLRRLSRTRLSIARAHLKAGRTAQVKADVESARAAERSTRGRLEGTALLFLGDHPSLLRMTLRAWYVVRGIPPTIERDPG